MENREISKMLSGAAKLMELHGVNEFKVRSVQNAAFCIGRMEIPLKNLSSEQLINVKGIGKSIGQKILQMISTGSLSDVDEFLRITPPGVVEMMNIKGVGPKKVGILWKELGVESPGELLYACNENRLVELKGFGTKTQELISHAIEFSLSNKGLFHYASVEKLAKNLLENIQILDVVLNAAVTGEMRRRNEIIDKIEILISTNNKAVVKNEFSDMLKEFEGFTETKTGFKCKHVSGIKFNFIVVNENEFAFELLKSTGSELHLSKLKSLPGFNSISDSDVRVENEIYTKLGLSFIEPELREGNDEVELAQKNEIPELVKFSDLKGILHNHSTYSDGMNTLKEMAVHCKELGFEYLGICDHSKSAFYANGLTDDRVRQQHEEIDMLNRELHPFRIFKGIESDILNDGSLDYPDAILNEFEFIVASVHSGLKMNEQKATERLIKAVSNPHTTILGHPTGRLLLAREGYPIDHKAVIDACAKHNVIIELNAHPYRLDLDWRWIRYAVSQNVMISINPDAHHLDGYNDMHFGVNVARKGMLTAAMTFNVKSMNEVDAYFTNRRKA